MIDIEFEEAFPLRRAREKIPGRPSYSTLWRWATKGAAGGVRLETIRKPGEHLTTMGAIKRFLADVTERKERRLVDAERERQAPPAPKNRQETGRRRAARTSAARRAENELGEEGV